MPRKSKSNKKPDAAKLDRIVANAQKQREAREQGYREQSLRIHPWICGRCGREFTRANLQELTVHHKDHNHDNNPPDGSNWENLCVYCHDNEHARFVHLVRGEGYTRETSTETVATHKPFAGLDQLLHKTPKG